MSVVTKLLLWRLQKRPPGATRRPRDQPKTNKTPSRAQQEINRRPSGDRQDTQETPGQHQQTTSTRAHQANPPQIIERGKTMHCTTAGDARGTHPVYSSVSVIKIGMRRDRMCSIIMLGIFGANFSAGAEQGCQSVLFPLQERTPQCDQELLGEPILEASSDNQCSKLELKRLAITNKG